MKSDQPIYVLGAGAVGFPLAVYLANTGRRVVAVRTSRSDLPAGALPITVHTGERSVSTTVETVPLADLAQLDGIVVVAAKSHANAAIAQALTDKAAAGPIVLLQNGLGVERPFLDAGFSSVYRCVLYVTAQPVATNDFLFRPVTASPIGIVKGSEAELQRCVSALTSDAFPFRTEANIQRETWKKAIINVVFNSICPLLDIDNGVFARDAAAATLARRIVGECVILTNRLKLQLSEQELMEQVLLISRRSDGQLISTLQDIRAGRQTEIESLNLEIARVAAEQRPSIELPNVELLGNLIAVKSLLQIEARRTPGGEGRDVSA
jgi:2-dehydropantoate 2-reductase